MVSHEASDMGEDNRRGTGQGQLPAQYRAAGTAVTARRPGAPVVGRFSPSKPAWDWEAGELAQAERDELEALRVQHEALVARTAEMEASAKAAAEHTEALRDALRRLADARWPRRRTLVRELRDAGLLGG